MNNRAGERPRFPRLHSATSLVRMRDQPHQSVLRLMVTVSHSSRNGGVHWKSVLDRIQRCPDEVVKEKILHLCVCRPAHDYPPVEVIRTLIQIDPEAIRKDDSILASACVRRAKLEILEAILEQHPVAGNVVEQFWGSYRDLLGEDNIMPFLCEGSREASSVIVRLERLLLYSTLGCSMAVHGAARLPCCPPNVLRLFCCLYPKQLFTPDEEGWLPIHHIALNTGNDEGYQERLDILISEGPTSLQIRDSNGALPLHLAVQNGMSWKGIQRLTVAYPEALRKKYKGFVPVLGASMKADLDVIYFLALAAPEVFYSY